MVLSLITETLLRKEHIHFSPLEKKQLSHSLGTEIKPVSI